MVLDNYANSSPEALRRVRELAGSGAAGRLQMIEGDIRCSADLERAFAAGASTGTGVDAVIHFAVHAAMLRSMVWSKAGGSSVINADPADIMPQSPPARSCRQPSRKASAKQ